MMDRGKLRKIFGVGPKGAVISLLLLAIFAWIDRMMGNPAILLHSAPMKAAGAVLVVIGLGLHFWTVWTLRNWWLKDRLCTLGPFKCFRHPMYAAWITFISLGVALYLNSWVFLFWVVLLHPIWHRLVIQEETMMLENFGDAYRAYAIRTGRFIPRI